MTTKIYLLTGPEIGEKNDYIEEIKSSIREKYGSSDEFLFYANDSRLEDVVAQLSTESLFTPATCIVLRGVESIKKKEEVDLLNSWIKSSSKNDDTSVSVLIMVSDEISVDSKLEKIIPKENKKIFWEMFEDRKETWLYNYFKKNGYSLEPEAALSILDMIENNTEELRRECSRLFLCFPTGKLITEEDVENVLSHNREESAFTLFDAMIDDSLSVQKRFDNCLQILQKILLSKNNDFVLLIAGLVSCFRKLSLWKSIHANGQSLSDNDLRSFGFTSKKAKNQYTKASRVWTNAQVAAIIAILSKTDMEIRSSGTTFVNTILSMMIHEIVVKKGVYSSSYEFC